MTDAEFTNRAIIVASIFAFMVLTIIALFDWIVDVRYKLMMPNVVGKCEYCEHCKEVKNAKGKL